MGKKSKLQKYIEQEEKEIEDARKLLDSRMQALNKMKKIENGETK